MEQQMKLVAINLIEIFFNHRENRETTQRFTEIILWQPVKTQD